MQKFPIAAAAALLLSIIPANAQPTGEGTIKRYEPDLESYTPVKEYNIPDVLTCNNGKQVKNTRQWEKIRRPEILSIYAQEMFGAVPGKPQGMHFALSCPDETVYGGKAVRRRVTIWLDSDEQHGFEVLVHLPADHEGPVPMFVGLNFRSVDNAFDGTRYQWPFEALVDEGFGLAMAFHSSIEPDGKEFGGRSANVRDWFRPAEEWGAISAWAWGMSRIVDYLETIPEVDCSRIAAIGHSRLGKAALWAGANDPRFSLVISNNSGCCGAATNARMYGETFERIYRTFPYWFVPEFEKYGGRDGSFPVDQNALVSLIAPRPVYIASASEDHWADPEGEWLTAVNAAPVFALYGLEGVTGPDMPGLGHCDDYGSIAYKIHDGIHALWWDDWLDYIKYAKRIFNVQDGAISH